MSTKNRVQWVRVGYDEEKQRRSVFEFDKHNTDLI